MKQPHFAGLRARLIVLVLLAAAPALAYILFSGFDLRQRAEMDAVNRAQHVINLVAKTQQQIFQETHQLLSILAQVPQVHQGSTACSSFLAGLLRQHPRYTNLGLLNRNGDVVCSAQPLKAPVNVADRLYFQRALATRLVAVGEYQIGRITGKPAINIGYPLPDRSEEVQSVIFAAIDLAWLRQLALDSQLPENSSLTMIDRNGTVLLRYPDANGWVGRSVVQTDLFKAMRTKAGGVMQAPGLDNVERLHAFATLHEASGEPQTYLSIGIPVAFAFATANESLQHGLLGLGMVTLLTLVIAWIGSDAFILRRVSALLAAVRRVAAGDLSARADVAPRKDEIGELSHAFDNMAESLERRNTRIREDEVRIDRLNRIYAVLSNINSAIIRIHERDALLQEACRIAVDEGRFRLACISLIDSDTHRLVPVYISGKDRDMLHEIRLRLPDNAADDTHGIGAALLAGEPVVVNDLAHDARAAASRETALRHGYRSCTLLPLQTGGKLIGCIHLYADERGFFDDQEMKLLLELAADISLGLEYIEKEDKLHNLANYDLLTGLPNRDLYRDRLEQSLSRARHHKRHVAVMMLHIDRLKEVNSLHGQHVGDMLLREAARRLRGMVREGDTVARAGSSVFSIVLSDVAHTRDVILVARKITNIFAEPIDLEDMEFYVTIRIGIAVSPEDGDDVETILKNAEVALNISQREAGNTYRFYTPEINTRAMERFEIERELRRALERRELVLHYQPVIDMRSGSIIGCEALLRWNSQTLGTVSPGRFIPVAEETDLIVPIGEWVLETACAQGRRWHEQGLNLRLAVNISAKQLRRPEFPDTVLTILRKTGLDPATSPLTMEITESQLMENAEGSAELLKNLQARGFSVSIDDFGTGYSSLSYLKRLPVDTLKIDISFIRDITRSHDDAAIVKAIIALAHSLDMKVVAEGVETQEQFTALSVIGCDAAQGFLFSPAVPAAEFEKLNGRSFAPRVS